MPYPGREYNIKHPHDASVQTLRGHFVATTLIRAYWSPAHTTGQRYIYSASADAAVYIYGAKAAFGLDIFLIRPGFFLMLFLHDPFTKQGRVSTLSTQTAWQEAC